MFLYMNASADYEKERKSLEDLKKQVKNLSSNRMHLDQPNQDQAVKNRDIAKEYVENIMTGLRSRYPKPIEEAQTVKDVNKFKINLGKMCDEMRAILKNANVSVPESLEKFTMEPYLGRFAVIKPEEVFYIQQHRKIIQELVELIEDAKLLSLDSFLRKQEVKPVRVEALSDFEAGYSYHTYIIEVTGKYESIKGFVNSLNNSRYLFLIRSLDITAEDVIKDAVAASGGSLDKDDKLKDLGKNKEERLAINDLANVKLSITLDYIDFNSYELP